ncbi:MAG: xylulokinase [Kiritimatiellaeota bacterium]|nr:xylulokinase [Kiritimatiellota bacterium]
MKDTLFIGIDNGTQGTKVAVFSLAKGALVASAYAPHGMIENTAGRREQKPEWWIAAAEKGLAACLKAPGVKAQDVVAIGVSGQQHGCVPLDAEGKVIRPAKLWCDTETVPECEAITKAMGGAKAVVREIGNSVAAGFTASKVRWMKDHEPKNYDRLVTILLPHDYVNFWLTGERKTECGDASGTAYFDVRKRKWSEKLLKAIDPSGKLKSCMPELIASDDPVGVVRPALAKKYGFKSDVLVSSGGGDNMMAAIGTGNVKQGIVTASIGTSGTIFAYADSPVIDKGGELAAFCSSSGGWMPLVCAMNVTVATEQTRALLGHDVKTFDAMVAKAPVGAGGIMLLPYFNGERTPARPLAKASFTGITTVNFTPENLCRAAMEGATLGMRYGLELVKRQGIAPKEIRLVGGGAKSPIWRRIAADAFGCPVVCPASSEAGAMGGILQALWCHAKATGKGVPLSDLTKKYIALDESTRTLPDKKSVALYDDLYSRFRAFDTALRAFWR